MIVVDMTRKIKSISFEFLWSVKILVFTNTRFSFDTDNTLICWGVIRIMVIIVGNVISDKISNPGQEDGLKNP